MEGTQRRAEAAESRAMKELEDDVSTRVINPQEAMGSKRQWQSDTTNKNQYFPCVPRR